MEDRHAFHLHQPDATLGSEERSLEDRRGYQLSDEESVLESVPEESHRSPLGGSSIGRHHRHASTTRQDEHPVRPSSCPRELHTKESVLEYLQETRGAETDDCFQAHLRKSKKLQQHHNLGHTDNDEDDEDDDEIHHPLLSIPWYCRPVQRQYWDDRQVLPHVNWGDLFFDLFYVAAAFNLGVMILSALDSGGYQWPRGVVYFIGIFGPLYNMWENDVMYWARYTLVDHAHRLFSLMRFACVCLAVLSIKPIKFLSDKHSFETLALTSALFGESMLQLGLKLELYFFAEGDRTAIRNHTRRRILFRSIPTSLTYLVAAFLAGYSFFDGELDSGGGGGSQGQQENQAYENGYNGNYENSNDAYTSETAETSYANTDDHHDDGHVRFLAASVSTGCAEYSSGHRMLGGEGGDGCDGGMVWSIADVPLILCMTIYIFNLVHTLYRQYDTVGNRDANAQYIRQHYVPYNVDFVFHRYGEWLMLMIGESILSLLIVETTETAEYYGITAMGCLTVIIIQMIIFESEPSHSNGHALSRSMFTATLYGMLIQLLSASLIAFGVSYKIMLTNVLMQVEEEEQEHEEGHRILAGGTIDIPDKTVASLYCYSLAVILLTLELMLTTQKSVTKSYAVLCRDLALCRFWSVNWPLLIICLFKVVLIAYTLSLSQWSWASQTLKVNIMGFLIVTNMATTRVVGWGVVQHDNDIKEKMVSIKSRAVSIILSTRSLPKRKSRAKTPASGRSLSSRSHSSSTTDDRISMDEALFEAPIERLEPPSDRAGEIKQLNKYVI